MPLDQLRWLFFGFSGRINRAAYLLAGLLMIIIVIFIVYRLALAQEAGSSGAIWEGALSIILFASLWAQAALGVKRIHDIGRPGIFAAALFVPAVNIVVFLALCLIPGERGPNQYGKVTNSPS